MADSNQAEAAAAPALRRMRRRARLLHRIGRARRGSSVRRDGVRSAVHVSPVMFGPDGIIGGGERAAYGFAAALARKLPTTLVATGPHRESAKDGELTVEIYPAAGELGGQRFDPLCYRFLEQLRGVDIVHCHQYRVAVSQLAILAGAAMGKRTFVTDLGGVGTHFDPELAVEECLTGVIAVSEFSLRWLPSGVPSRVIPAGVGTLFLEAGAAKGPLPGEASRVLYVGRVMRHKGIDVLVRGLPHGVGLDIVGHVYDAPFYALLRELATGRDVRFIHDASDQQLVQAYRRALVTVLPSVHLDAFGGVWEMPELLGCVLQESMACGTPVICSDVGGMPEVVEHEVSGFVVPANDPVSLGRRICELIADSARREEMGRRARERALERFNWSAVAERTLSAYREC